MRLSQYFLPTIKETPHDAEIVSHQLMLRAGLIRRLGSGLYTWLPLGLKVLQKVENIVRQEMNASSALEVFMPAIQPAELWQETQRWEEFGPLLLKIQDRAQRDFCFGPTHEEVVTALVRHELNSYKQLPLNLYQIQTKFRDEIRPRFGVMRAREFLMKDAYSFHVTEDCLKTTYEKMYQAYCNIFDRLGLEYRAVLADTGSIGGSNSHEFQVLAQSGEDEIFYSDESDYAANVEKAIYQAPKIERAASRHSLEIVDTPNQRTIQAIADFLNLDKKSTVKTLLVEGQDTSLVALILRGDHELNELLAEKHPLVKSPLTFADEALIKEVIGCEPGSIGPVNLSIPIIADYDAATLTDFVCGANIDDKHYVHGNWERDAHYQDVTHLRKVVEGDISPDGKGTLQKLRGVEVGHIFQLGNKYSKAMNATVLDEHGKAQPLQMGCYGLGVSRVVAACIEQNHDEQGIIWPAAMAPFQVVILPMNMHKSEPVQTVAWELYKTLQNQGIEVLIDDRNERAGVMFADSELIGIPHQIILGEKSLKEGQIEYQSRRNKEKKRFALDEIIKIIEEKI